MGLLPRYGSLSLANSRAVLYQGKSHIGLGTSRTYVVCSCSVMLCRNIKTSALPPPVFGDDGWLLHGWLLLAAAWVAAAWVAAAWVTAA